jgi:tetratricopeptide (TPR) repeat protein
MAKKTNKTDEQFAAVEETLGRTEQWVENNQQLLSKIVFTIIGIIAIVLSYNNFYLDPLNEEANGELFASVNYFEKDSFNIALNGDGQYLSLLEVIEDYSSTDAGNLAQYYAGICYLKLGDNENAIYHLNKFNASDEIVSTVALGGIADAHANLGEVDKAISFWKKAASKSDNKFTAPLYMKRAALALEENGDLSTALKLYQNIKDNYSSSDEGLDIDKYITRASLMQ